MASGGPDWLIGIRTLEAPADLGEYDQVQVGLTATLIKGKDTARHGITISNQSSTDGYVGLDASLTKDNGMLLPAYSYVVIVRYTGEIYGVSPAGILTFGYMEFPK